MSSNLNQIEKAKIRRRIAAVSFLSSQAIIYLLFTSQSKQLLRLLGISLDGSHRDAIFGTQLAARRPSKRTFTETENANKSKFLFRISDLLINYCCFQPNSCRNSTDFRSAPNPTVPNYQLPFPKESLDQL